MADRDYMIDIPGLEGATGRLAAGSSGSARGHAGRGRPWLSIYFKCCHTYTRIYRNRAGDAYEGRCPKCGAAVHAAIGPDGTPNRFFTAE